MLNIDNEQSSDFKRYDKSELWSIHETYFKNIGLKAWSSGALPFTGVTSYTETQKKVILLVENLRLAGFEDNTETIKILEIGAGSGAFAKNFLHAFENTCNSLNLNFYRRLEYYLTDYAETTLDEIKNKNKLSEFSNIKFFTLDILDDPNNSSLKDHIGSFHCICSTYLLDQLPNRVIAKSKDQYYEKYIKINIPDELKNASDDLKKKVLKKNKWIKKIKKEFNFKEIDLESELPQAHIEPLKDCFREKQDSSTVIYSYGALKALENSIRFLHIHGLIIYSDFNAASRPKIDIYEPCYYGNSVAQPVNFTFLYNCFHKHQKIILFEDPIKPLHTMILCHKDYSFPLKLGTYYEKIFKQNIAFRVLFKLLVELKMSLYILLIVLVIYIIYYIFTEAAKLS
ncbi:MAG: SAM-dependent methyltransferase [Candidatus Caenarcaniphilales bacterium]|nr:SAM-dependent methyltransferase [Candidatus Caenarcaniphilales bacterium]